jgi:hypothetical protein
MDVTLTSWLRLVEFGERIERWDGHRWVDISAEYTRQCRADGFMASGGGKGPSHPLVGKPFIYRARRRRRQLKPSG